MGMEEPREGTVCMRLTGLEAQEPSTMKWGPVMKRGEGQGGALALRLVWGGGYVCPVSREAVLGKAGQRSSALLDCDLSEGQSCGQRQYWAGRPRTGLPAQ